MHSTCRHAVLPERPTCGKPDGEAEGRKQTEKRKVPHPRGRKNRTHPPAITSHDHNPERRTPRSGRPL